MTIKERCLVGAYTRVLSAKDELDTAYRLLSNSNEGDKKEMSMLCTIDEPLWNLIARLRELVSEAAESQRHSPSVRTAE